MSPIFSAQELHSIVGGKLFENDWSVSGISIDSRNIKNNDLFIACLLYTSPSPRD